MRLKPGRTKTTRSRERGVAAIEFALCLFFLIPLTLAVLDYGYYFYIGLNIVEAQQAGITAAARTAVLDCTNAANNPAKAAAVTAAQLAETTYLTNAGLNGTVTLVSTTTAPVCQCAAAATKTCWEIALAADFRPLIGRVGPWMKSVIAGKARYTAQRLVVNGR